ncbi:MAG: serine hydrolase [Gemmataceae bacterium]|nr:serine hydrolase [Gemmata sp.]MDW8197052.1 serine hydrolase [Gemmataceae bacterium]
MNVSIALAWASLLLDPAMASKIQAHVADAIVARALKTFQVPGAAVALVRGDQILLLKGYGQRSIDTKQPITADTIFPLASCTKQFTTTLLALLVDEKKLDWDTPVKKLYPAFQLSDPHANELLTLRDLVTHRTGLGSHDLLWYHAPARWDDILPKVRHLPLDYPFRSGYRYSSIPFVAAGRIAEKIGHDRWEKLIRNRLCEPLEMKNVYFTTTAIPRDADRAWGHRLNKNGDIERMATYEIDEPNPAGSLHTTARDLVPWLQFHLTNGIAPNGERLITSKALLETRSPQNLIRLDETTQAMFPETVLMSYAMGWVVNDYRGLKIVAHGGLIDGFRVQLTLVPEKNLACAILTNRHDNRLPLATTNALIDLYLGLPPRDWIGYYRKLVDAEAAAKRQSRAARDQARDPSAPPSLALADFAGSYEHPAYGRATVQFLDNRLTLRFSGFTCSLEHYERDTFRITDGFFEDELTTFRVRDQKPLAVKFMDIEFHRK